jgi:UDP-N-acetylglucosamine diphosphorylase/glucosamine-1-phosphate N-acetyltransferase
MAEKLTLIIFEDNNASGFYPLSVSHPVYDLLYGCFDVVERFTSVFRPAQVMLVCRGYLAEISKRRYGLPVNDFSTISGECLLVNAALKPDKKTIDILTKAKRDSLFFCGEQLVGGKLSKSTLAKYQHNILALPNGRIDFGSDLKKINTETSLFAHLWDLVNYNGEAISSDFNLLKKNKGWSKPSQSGLTAKMLVHRSAQIAKGAYFDTSLGPIVIDKDVVIEARSVIQGPSYIGKGSRIMGGLVREGCSLGPVCKVGGELEESIILGYSNKCHEGFIGHAYLGEWVNLGAMTTNSDLKNNYTPITVSINSTSINTNSLKVGSFMGDHTKTGIGTLFNTGIVIGFCCNLFGGGLFMQKEIPHYTWGTPKDMVEFKLDKAIEVAGAAMARRKQEMNSVIRELFEEIKRQKDNNNRH